MNNIRAILWQERVHIVLFLLPLIAGVMWWDILPEQIPSHWNFHGEIDAYSGKVSGVLFVPLLAIGMWITLVIAPLWAKKQGREQLQEKAWKLIRFATTLLLSVVQFAILFTALGHQVDMVMVLYYALVLFFILMGNVIGTVRPNYLVGVRVPWTLKNEEVWRKTHRFTGWLWVVLGVLFFVAGTSFRSGSYSEPFAIFIGLTSIPPVIYSYFISRHHKA